MPKSVLEALAANEFFIAVQPIVDLEEHKVFAYEGLARSRSKDFDGPLAILNAAIFEGCIGELGRAFRQMTTAMCQTNVFLNIHPNEFGEGWLVRPDDPIFSHEHGVYVEITESVPLSHFELCHGVLTEIRSKGIKLVVDDLGAGYSNLKYIADLYPEVVKLDRELVQDLDKQPRLRKLVRSIVNLCDDLGAKVVAEGIETPGELEAVRDAGVHYAQGYLLARPANPAPEVNWKHLVTPRSPDRA